MRIGLEGNLCRCTGYHNIVKAVLAAAEAGAGMTGDRRPRPRRSSARRCSARRTRALLTGEAKFTDDLAIPGALHLAVLRSPYAHARITQHRRRAARRAMPGVVAAYTGADLRRPVGRAHALRVAGHAGHEEPAPLPAGRGQGLLRGRRVAVVLATSDAEAPRRARAPSTSTTSRSTAVIDLEDALSATACVIHDDPGTNTSYTWELEDRRGRPSTPPSPRRGHTVKERYIQQRLIPMAMEPRAVAAVPQPFGGGMTLYSATQIPHILKIMAALTLGIPEHQMRVVAPSVGGGFGSKLNVYAEELLCVALARKHGVPVRWVEERTENAQATIQGRGQIQDIELAADANGKLTAVRVQPARRHGRLPPAGHARASRSSAPSSTPACTTCPAAYDFSCTSVFTTMTPDRRLPGRRPARGHLRHRAGHGRAGRARSGSTRSSCGERNFIQAEQFPYTAFTGLVYDSGDHLAAADEGRRAGRLRRRPGRAGPAT